MANPAMRGYKKSVESYGPNTSGLSRSHTKTPLVPLFVLRLRFSTSPPISYQFASHLTPRITRGMSRSSSLLRLPSLDAKHQGR